MNFEDALRYLETPVDKYNLDNQAMRILIIEIRERLKKLEGSGNEKNDERIVKEKSKRKV